MSKAPSGQSWVDWSGKGVGGGGGEVTEKDDRIRVEKTRSQWPSLSK